MRKTDKVKLKPLSKRTSDRLIREFKHIAEQHYNKEITSREFEYELNKLGYKFQGKLLKENGIEANVKLTKEILDFGLSKNGGYNDKQIEAHGTTKKNNKGWYRGLFGKLITQHQVDRFLELKDAHIKNK